MTPCVKSALLLCALLALPSWAQSPDSFGTISGTVVDRSGAVVTGAQIKLEGGNQTHEVLSGTNGQFSFSNISAGNFQLTATATGFAPQTTHGTLQSGQVLLIPPITLAIAAPDTVVQADVSPVAVAQEQIRDQEQQHVLRVVPNFYVSYVHGAAPLNSRQKFELAWKTLADPFSFIAVGAVAGVEQAQNDFNGYGQGSEGYAKRYGASYAGFASGTLIGAAILPSILKQDPRYFYKGTGSKSSRLFYALVNAVICKGDNMRWQPNYSGILGSLAAGGLSNLYYPEADRNGARLTFENAAIGIGTAGALNVMEEFVVRKFTPHQSKEAPRQ